MRIDVVTIFPDYLAPLELSLIGRARRAGLVDVVVHDLRDFTTDRHRTVDDTPYGGGAGMVMKPEPWGRALEHVRTRPEAPGGRPRLLLPSPGGRRFDQAMARELAAEPWLVFGCGRYEGIDERVAEAAAEHFDVTLVSLGDYVLNGGEVAVLAITEAVARLLPGVVGNAESLVEESHEDGLLEYPVYTKPAVWQGREVPAVLLSGDHAAIAAWRHQQRLERTAARRPDLLSPASAARPDELAVVPAVPADAPELWTLQLAGWVSEAHANPGLRIPPLHEELADVRASLEEWSTWVVRSAGRLVGSVRGRLQGEDWEIGRLAVAPDLQGRGLGRRLLAHAESTAPPAARRAVLTTGEGSARNLRFYRRAGYRPAPESPVEPGTVLLAKPLRSRRTGAGSGAAGG
ncbi:tRNA (guanosine(37)-N1)-methyltransferase TrmD [Auraticoccus sp. F435]|uniref:tRNA (guanine-N(1)-)-methyltransferase n=1 Tax=Auraticoccus cholistanensis TaxID=2656650 RepID=A0A6A9UXY6_9ACTN|nr:tRNA (guanosine(37)-N1)-methyltransferase TrmD [Auraticoccus cholistanensis]